MKNLMKFLKKKFIVIDFNSKKMQKYLKKIIELNKNIDNINIKDEYYKLTKIALKLNTNEISKIKTSIRGEYKGLTLLECIKKLKELNEEKDFNSQDIKYNIKLNNNKIETKEEKIIALGIKNNLELMNIIDFNDYFIDITFKVIPKKFRHNKIETVDKKN